MQKRFKLVTALLIGLFAIPMMSNAVFAEESYDNIPDGEYDISVRSLEKDTDKESVANDFVHNPTLTIEDGNPTLTLGIGASDDGAYADFDFNINWVKVEGKKPIAENEKENLIYYTFQLNSVKTKIPAQMEYVVPDFPALADGHEVEFDLELNLQKSVTATYVDQNGKEIKDSETLEGIIGSDYETEQKDIDGYDFVEVNGDETGKFIGKTEDVEYVYEKQEVEVEQGIVNVTYVDQEGEEIADSEKLEGDVGETYEAKQKDIDNYKLVKVNGDKNGEYVEGTTPVEFVYEKEQTEDTEEAPEEREVGELLTEDEADAVYELEYGTDSKATAGQLGNPVHLLKKDGNQYIQIPVNESGAQFFRSLKINGKEVTWNSITEGPYTIQFELPGNIEDELELSMVIQAGPKAMSHDGIKVSFDKDTLKTIKDPKNAEQGTVKVTYVDQEGNVIAEAEMLKGDIGEAYKAKQKAIDGYKFMKVNGDKTGEFAEGTTVVEYVYEKQEEGAGNDQGTVDGNGNEGATNPETGISSNILFYFLLLIGSGVPLAFIAKRRFA